MKNTPIPFGSLSGFYSSIGLLPHLLFLTFLWIRGMPAPLTFLITFTVAAKILGEWLFWRYWKERIDGILGYSDWKIALNQALASNQIAKIALLTFVLDICVDITLIYVAMKTSLSLIVIFITLLGCQTLSSLFQGYFSDRDSQKKSMIFAQAIEITAITLSALPYFGDEITISHFSPSTLALIALCLKGCLGNSTVIARASIANVLKSEALKKIR